MLELSWVTMPPEKELCITVQLCITITVYHSKQIAGCYPQSFRLPVIAQSFGCRRRYQGSILNHALELGRSLIHIGNSWSSANSSQRQTNPSAATKHSCSFLSLLILFKLVRPSIPLQMGIWPLSPFEWQRESQSWEQGIMTPCQKRGCTVVRDRLLQCWVAMQR